MDSLVIQTRCQEQIVVYQRDLIRRHGPVPKGVGWNGPEAQSIRFRQLLKIMEPSLCPVTLLDYGCGYGALVDELKRTGLNVRYVGYDLVEESIAHAKALHGSSEDPFFTTDRSELCQVDYTLASGLFSQLFMADEDQWRTYVQGTLAHIAGLSRRGFSFNMLSNNNTFCVRNLYYADPTYYLDYCKHTFSDDCTLLSDYGLYDFTILVRFRRRDVES